MKRTKTDLENEFISFCRGCKNPATFQITVDESLKRIKSDAYKISTLKCRDMEIPEEERDRTKQKMDAFLFSGSFSYRNVGGLEHYSKLLVFDIDHLQNAEEVKAVLKDDPYVIAIWISVRGQGVKGLIPLDYSEIENSSMNEDEEISWAFCHKKLAFEQVKVYFKDKYDITLDPSGSDVSRLCFASYDPDLIIKDEAVCFHVSPMIDDKPTVKRKRIGRSGVRKAHCQIIENEVKKMERPNNVLVRRQIQSIIKFLSKRDMSITGNYNDWYLVGQAIANTFSYSIGKEYYLRLCRIDGQFHDETKSIKKIIECYKNDDPNNMQKYVGMGYIRRRAKERGWINRAESTRVEKNKSD